MKLDGRVKLYMVKKICKGMLFDDFTAIVSKEDVDNTKKMYEGMGYVAVEVNELKKELKNRIINAQV